MKKYKVVCTVAGSQMLGHLLVWSIFTLLSFGLLAPFWLYTLVKLLLNGTELHEIEQSEPVPAAAPAPLAPVVPAEPEVMPRPRLVMPNPQL